jgi:predicted metal-dependent peptidase
MFQDSVEQSACGSGGDTANRIASERKSSSPQDWVSYAQQFIETRCEDGWLAPYNHGVYVASGLCAPGREGKKVGDIIVVADSSGSINREAWDKFIELNQYILDEVEPNRLLLLSCSDKVKDHVILEVGETVPSSFRGGGGTSFKAAFDWVTEDPHHLCIDPLLLIYFTDGVCTDHKQMTEPEYPVLWLSYKKPKSHFPWGEFAAITLT